VITRSRMTSGLHPGKCGILGIGSGTAFETFYFMCISAKRTVTVKYFTHAGNVMANAHMDP